MLELRRLLDAGYDVASQPGDGTAADGSRSYECCWFVDLRDSDGRRVETGLGPTKPVALAELRLQACATLGGADTKPAGRPLVSGHAGGRRDPLPDHVPPAPKHLGGAGSEPSVEAYVDGLDGAEQKVLLNHIAQAWPEVVEAGVKLVAQWRAECAERRHAADKRKSKERRRRQRADARRAELVG